MTTPCRIVIVGRDAALWLTAAALQCALGGAGVTVTAVELPSALGPAALYTALPPLEALHAKLGLDEAVLLRATGGSFSLGWNVVSPAGAAFFLAHGSYGVPIDGAPFLPNWVKARRFGLLVTFEDFSLTAAAARHGRMLLPDDHTARFARTDYGYHLPALPYVTLLKARALRLDVALHQAAALTVERDAETVTALRLDTGENITGDLFIDASGREAVLFGAMPDAVVTGRKLTARAAALAATPVYGEVRVGAESWTALDATPGATYVVHAFVEEQADDAALADATRIAGLPLGDAVVEPIVTGVRAAPWHGNRIAIGETAAQFDPLFDVTLHAVQLGIVHLVALFPAHASYAAERAEYNRVTASAFARLGDFAAAFQRLNDLGDTGFWREARERPVSAELDHKLATFQARGMVAPMEDETFSPDLWAALAVGLGAVPESWSPAIDRTAPEQVKQALRGTLGQIRETVLEQPTHDAYLARLQAGRQ